MDVAPAEKVNKNIIQTTLPRGFTPGQALLILRRKGKGGRFIRKSELRMLCYAARRGEEKDAQVILTALNDFRRVSNMIIDEETAKAAMEGILRAKTLSDDGDGWDKIQAASFVAKAFCDRGETNGLFYAATPVDLENIVLKNLLEGVHLIKNEDGDDEKIEEIKTTTQNLVKMMVYRASRPEKRMRRRSRAKYLRQLKVSDGPRPETIHLATQICLNIGKPDDAKKGFIFHYRKWNRGKVLDQTKQLLRDAEEALAMESSQEQEESEDSSLSYQEDDHDVDDSHADSDDTETDHDETNEADKKDQ